MKKKLLSLLVLVALVSSCGTTQKTVSSHKPIVSRVPEKVLTESKHSETYINKEVPETPEELKATSAVKGNPAIRAWGCRKTGGGAGQFRRDFGEWLRSLPARS